MSVSIEDVWHIASLARIGLSEERAQALVPELNSILEHMEVLTRIDSTAVGELAATDQPPASPLRPDTGPPFPLRRSVEAFAPEMRDNFFLVPRLATHEETAEER